MPLTYRAFEATDADFSLLSTIDSCTCDGPRSVDQIRQEEKCWDPDQLHDRSFILLGEECIGATIHYNQPGDKGRGTHSCRFTLLPAYRGQDWDAQILRHLFDRAKTHGAVEVYSGAYDHETDLIQELERLGFQPATSYVVSQLNLDSFDPHSFASKIGQVEQQGITIRSAIELSQEGIDWLRLNYDLNIRFATESIPDYPGPRHTFEQFKEIMKEVKIWFPPGQYTAFDGGTCIGITSVSLIASQPGTAHTGLTEVLTSYRRKGIATALKVASLNAAKQEGIRFVKTINESTIPMLQLNYQLGFKKLHASLGYKKTIETRPSESIRKE